MERVILLDKPEGPTSHDMVDALRAALGTRRVGHTGTLDPMASGLLVMLTGRATRLAEIFSGHDKLYRGRVSFGTSTDTDDREGKVLDRAEDFKLNVYNMNLALAELAERSEQRAPAYSAVKVGGVPLYKQARRGLEVEPPMRRVTIHKLELLDFGEDEAELEILCSAGTYIRSLARDLGELLGVPAHLSALRRLAAGPFRLEDAADLAEIQEGPAAAQGLSMGRALEYLPIARIAEKYLPRLRHGNQPGEGDLVLPNPLPPEGTWVALREESGTLHGLARVEMREEGLALRLRRTLESGE